MADPEHTGRATASAARRAGVVALGLLLVVSLTACGAHHRSSRRSRSRIPQTTHSAEPPARLVGAHPRRRIGGFTCAWLPVALDHADPALGTLRLAVAVQQVPRPAHGVLLLLTGGPGQPGVSLVPRVVSRLGSILHGYRLVMFDQRGTGAAALRCPALQAAAGSSDLAVVPPAAVASCARTIGPDRRYFTTPETVADIEALRIVLGAAQLTLDGVSYGTYVAERYALTHPQHVARLVLDSVVPQQGVDPLYVAALEATARVLRSACAQRCSWDPARDVLRVVHRYHDGPQLLNALVAESIAVPTFSEVLGPLHQAASGHPKALVAFLAATARYESAPAGELSQGLHESTLCLDLAPPWNSDAAPTCPSAGSQARARCSIGRQPVPLRPCHGVSQRPCPGMPAMAADRAARGPRRQPSGRSAGGAGAPAGRPTRPLDPAGMGPRGGRQSIGRPARGRAGSGALGPDSRPQPGDAHDSHLLFCGRRLNPAAEGQRLN